MNLCKTPLWTFPGQEGYVKRPMCLEVVESQKQFWVWRSVGGALLIDLDFLWEGEQGMGEEWGHASHPVLPDRKKSLAVLQQQVHCLSLLGQLYNLEATPSSRRFACLAALMQKNSAEELAHDPQVNKWVLALSPDLAQKPTMLGREALPSSCFRVVPQEPRLTGAPLIMCVGSVSQLVV